MNKSANVKVLYRQNELPVFQNRMYETAETARSCPKGDVVLVEDQDSGMVYNSAFQSELVVYDSAYQNEQGVSPQFREHLQHVANIVERNMGRSDLVEVGCGKGLFLEMLLQKGVDIKGFDPTYEGSNPLVERHFFNPGLGIEAKGIILRHVLEHIQNPYEFLVHLKEANGGSGNIYIEVPCFDWICDRSNWFDVFYEHVNYFRLSNFHQMFGRILESGRIFGGQYLYVVAELASLRPPAIGADGPVEFPGDFSKGLSLAGAFTDKPVIVWGGASKGVIYSLLSERAGHPVAAVIDINPAKQGKFLPATGIQVQTPEILSSLPGDSVILIMNSNYGDEIRRLSNGEFQYVEVDNA